jgi:hypothetical protein
MNYRESLVDLVDIIRQNDESSKVVQLDSRIDSIENLAILDALKKHTIVERFHFVQLSQEALVKLSEVMKCNSSGQILDISIRRGLQREGLFATMATSGGWSSLQTLYLAYDRDDDINHQSYYTDAEHSSSFIVQSENLHTLHFTIEGDDAVLIVETLSRTKTKVQRLEIMCGSTFPAQNGGRRLATALERCTCITELRLVDAGMESLQIVWPSHSCYRIPLSEQLDTQSNQSNL